MKWSKLLANLVGNALSALADRDPATVYADPALFDLERRQLLEALAVMRAQGIRPVALPGANVPLLALGDPAARARSPGSPCAASSAAPAAGSRRRSGSTCAAGRRGRRRSPGSTGPWRARARAHGVPTPVNAALAALVDAATVDPGLAADLAAEPARIVEPGGRRAGRASLAGRADPEPPADPRPDHPGGPRADARDRDPQPERPPPAPARASSSAPAAGSGPT